MCLVSECGLAIPAKLHWLTGLSQNVSRLWVQPGISCQTGLDWQCSLNMCPGCECDLAFPAKVQTGLTVLSQNVSSLSVWFGISYQTGMADSAISKCVQAVSVTAFSTKLVADRALSKCVQRVSVTWHVLPNWTGWQCCLKMCPVCECDLAFSAGLLSENMSSMWVCPGISCHTWLAENALSKCVQAVSVPWHFLQNWTDWQGFFKMCPVCECDLAFSAKLDWLTVPSQNMSSMWVWPRISCQTGLADSALSKCVQAVSLPWHFLSNWTGWQCFLKMCPGCECNLEFPAKLDWLTGLFQNVSRLWVWSGNFCQTGLANRALSKCVQAVSVPWHFLSNWTGWHCSLKMCPGCECDLGFPAKLDCLIVLSQNVSREWVQPGISCQTGLADSVLSKCVQAVSVIWHFLPNWSGWQCSFKMCPGCECDLASTVKLDWLTGLSQNVSRLWVQPGISCQTGLADSALSKCVQGVSATWDFLPNWTGWQGSLKICLGSECALAFPAKLDWLTMLFQNMSRKWVWPGFSCQTRLADRTLSKCVQDVSVPWHFLLNWTG